MFEWMEDVCEINYGPKDSLPDWIYARASFVYYFSLSHTHSYSHKYLHRWTQTWKGTQRVHIINRRVEQCCRNPHKGNHVWCVIHGMDSLLYSPAGSMWPPLESPFHLWTELNNIGMRALSVLACWSFQSDHRLWRWGERERFVWLEEKQRDWGKSVTDATFQLICDQLRSHFSHIDIPVPTSCPPINKRSRDDRGVWQDCVRHQ